MYAIVQSGGHQVRMTPGDVLVVDRLAAEVGSEVTFDQVLFVARDGGEMIAGAPLVANARVVALVTGEARGPKLRVFKKKRRKGMRRTKGHHSRLTRIQVKEIVLA